MTLVRIFLAAVGCAVIAVGGVVWAGWIFQLPTLTTFGVAGTPMGANAAVCAILLGAALLSRLRDHLKLARTLAGITGLILALTILQGWSDHDFGVDRWLGLRFGPALLTPPPMPTFTACASLLLGLSLALAPRKNHWVALWMVMGGAVLLMSLLGLFSFLITLNSEQSWSAYRGVGLPTALALALSGLGLLGLIGSRRGELGVTCCLMAAAVAVVLAVAATTRQSLAEFRLANIWVARTLETEVAIERLGGTLARLDASTRAFVLTNSPPFLAETKALAAGIRAQLAALDPMFLDHALQEKRLRGLAPSVEKFVREKEVIVQQSQARGASSLPVVTGSNDESLTNTITALMTEMRNDEQVRRVRAFEEIHQTESYTRMLQALAGLVAATLIGLAFWLAWRAALIRQAAESALTVARDQALEHSRLKSEFLANMSHEIRTPMNGVIGMTSLLATTPVTDEQREYVETIRVCGESMLILINDILDFSKIESGHIDLEEQEFDVVACVDETMALFKTKAREKQLELSYRPDASVPRRVVSDVTRVRQVVANLISNAIKFTPAGKIEVSLRRLDGPVGVSCLLEIQVRDSGIGIPEEKRHRLFQPFSQVETSTNRRFGGTGLGLSISRRLSELMGGGLTVESIEGVGSTFKFTIRVGLPETTSQLAENPVVSWTSSPSAAALETTPVGSHEQNLSPLKILLAEDNSTNQLVAQRMLAKLGYRVDTVANGQEVLEARARQRYEVILMDVQMPGIDGLEATKRVRLDPTQPQPWIVAMTANAMTGDRESCLAAGMNDYVAKPVKLEELQRVLSRAALNLTADLRDRHVAFSAAATTKT